MLHQRYKRRVENYLSLTKELSNESIVTKDTVVNDEERNNFVRSDSASTNDPSVSVASVRRVHEISRDDGNQCPGSPTPVVHDIEDLAKANGPPSQRGNEMCSSSFGCSGQSRQHCQELVRDYRQQQHFEFLEFYNSTQSLRHTVLLILLLCSMFVVSLINTFHIHMNFYELRC